MQRRVLGEPAPFHFQTTASMHQPPDRSQQQTYTREHNGSYGEGRPDAEEMNFATLAHLSGCAGLLGFGYVGFIGPLVIWWLKKDTSPYVEFQAKEAFNFQITILMVAFACGIAALMSCGTLFPLIFLPMVLQLIFGVLSVLEVRQGRAYRYPFNLRLMQ